MDSSLAFRMLNFLEGSGSFSHPFLFSQLCWFPRYRVFLSPPLTWGWWPSLASCHCSGQYWFPSLSPELSLADQCCRPCLGTSGPKRLQVVILEPLNERLQLSLASDRIQLGRKRKTFPRRKTKMLVQTCRLFS